MSDHVIDHYWSLPQDALITALNSNPEGLTVDEASRRFGNSGSKRN